MRALKEYNEALAAGDPDKVVAALDAVLAAKDAALVGAGESLGVQEYFLDMFNALEHELAAREFQIRLEADHEGLETSIQEALRSLDGLDNLDIGNLGDGRGTQEQTAAFEELVKIANECNFEITDFIGLLVELEYIQGKVTDQGKDLSASFAGLASAINDIDKENTFATGLYDRLTALKQQFQTGKIAVYDYFDTLATEINNVDFSRYTDSLEEAHQLQAGMFLSGTLEASQGMDELLSKFRDGSIAVPEYLDGLTSIAGVVHALTGQLQEHGDQWTENGIVSADSLDKTKTDLSDAISSIDQYKDSVYSLTQILGKAVAEGSDEFRAHTQVIAEDLAYIVQSGGAIAEEIKTRWVLPARRSHRAWKKTLPIFHLLPRL